jgi:hypothetical protein
LHESQSRAEYGRMEHRPANSGNTIGGSASCCSRSIRTSRKRFCTTSTGLSIENAPQIYHRAFSAMEAEIFQSKPPASDGTHKVRLVLSRFVCQESVIDSLVRLPLQKSLYRSRQPLNRKPGWFYEP